MTRTPSNAGLPAPPDGQVSLVEVRVDGALLKRVSQGGADQLVMRGWAEWRGTGRRRYLALTEGAPLSSQHGWGNRDGTRPMTANGKGRRDPGQVLGERRSHLEHIPPR